jgi:hypothetical protein
LLWVTLPRQVVDGHEKVPEGFFKEAVMPSLRTRAPRTLFSLPFHTCRNISGPEDQEARRRVLAGYAPAESFLELEDDENVREYLVDPPGKQKRSPTLVHKAIRETLSNHPDLFSILNGGFCLVCRSAEVDDKNRALKLDRPSIINGSQTQGEIKRYFKLASGSPQSNPSVFYQLIVTGDDALIADISIARNFQNDVQPISIAGRRGQLDELENAMQEGFPGARLRKTETDVSDEFVDTEKLVQVMFVLSPEAVWEPVEENLRITSKVTAYSQKTRCLKTFQHIFDRAGDGDEAYAQLYHYFLDIAADAWSLYIKWKKHPGFRGTRIQAIERDDRQILEVPDGIVFPILGSLSAFVRKAKGRWRVEAPENFEESRLIAAAADDYKEIANHNPQTMGKTKACYTSLHRLTSIYAEFLPRR